MTDRELFELAKEASRQAYASYSGFRVGAAACTANLKIYMGANIENAAFGAGICAERVALVKALYDGEREFLALAVYGEREDTGETAAAWPCGICRQFLSEFGLGTRVITGADAEHLETALLSELLPRAFTEF